jgi:hypothetical protein
MGPNVIYLIIYTYKIGQKKTMVPSIVKRIPFFNVLEMLIWISNEIKN